MKNEYIKKETVISVFNAKADMTIGAPKAFFCSMAKMVELLPAADVAEVKHGKWDKTPLDKDIFQTIRCSECGNQALFAFNVNAFGDQELFRFPSEFCPSCGAKMDEEGGKQ